NDKAAKVMIDLADNPQPPVHLLLGSEAVAMVKQATIIRNEELEKWLPVSTSTNADDAVDLTQTEMGKAFFGAKK
ncbi:MAG TPA: short-chain dehydrogenase/reductase, partial [Mucilaginibacter sp.]|nr:short-chain dehydrogenase/reductase [Mucilaginibacter sp.]